MTGGQVLSRLLVIVGAAVSAAVGLPALATAPLGLLSLVLTAELAVRLGDDDWAKRFLLGAGFVLASLVLVGLVLNLLPGGLTHQSWSAAWALVSVGVLGYRARPTVPARSVRLMLPRGAVWSLVCLAGLGVALWLAIAGTSKEPGRPLEFWVKNHATGVATVSVRSNADAGPFVVQAEAAGGSWWRSTPFRVPAGTAVDQTIVMDAGRRYSITLVEAANRAQLRKVVIDGTKPLPRLNPSGLEP